VNAGEAGEGSGLQSVYVCPAWIQRDSPKLVLPDMERKHRRSDRVGAW
jgi:hypothetical protein